jgi:hypothetical protein
MCMLILLNRFILLALNHVHFALAGEILGEYIPYMASVGVCSPKLFCLFVLILNVCCCACL